MLFVSKCPHLSEKKKVTVILPFPVDFGLLLTRLGQGYRLCRGGQAGGTVRGTGDTVHYRGKQAGQGQRVTVCNRSWGKKLGHKTMAHITLEGS